MLQQYSGFARSPGARRGLFAKGGMGTCLRVAPDGVLPVAPDGGGWRFEQRNGGQTMPLLPKEPSCYPPDLLLTPPPDADSRTWWVLHTKARQEKAVARTLFQQQIPFYLPLVFKTAMYGGRKRSSFTPLFTGYVFMIGADDERARALATNRVAQTIQVQDGQRLRSDLSQIRRLIETKAPLTVESRLGPGRAVRVRSGSFAGVEGTVVSRRGKCRLIVAVQLLQQGVSVEIDDFLLEPLD